MKQYLKVLEKIIDSGVEKAPARNNMPGTRQLFGELMEFDLRDGFPIITTKQVNTRAIFEELLWFLRGNINVADLIKNKVNIWNEDGYNWYVANLEHGDEVKSYEDWVSDATTECDSTDYNMGALYGQLWRNFGYHKIPISKDEDIVITGVDQILNLVNDIISNPNGRYKVVSAWNPYIHSNKLSALPSCHYLFQCNVTPDGHLDLNIIQRSADFPLGVPFNISSYALLLSLLAKMTNLKPGILKWFGQDIHIYENQIELAKEQITRKPYTLPTLSIHLSTPQLSIINEANINGWATDSINDFFNNLSIDNFQLENYKHHDKISYPFSSGIKK